MNRREFLAALGTAALVRPAERRPNILFILADDLGYGDLGCFGQKRIRTPILDRMAAQGMRFTQAYAGSTVCAPSRCSLMTGLHGGHCRIRDNIPHGIFLQPDDVTAAELVGMTAPSNLDGVSLVPALRGGRFPEHPYLYWDYGHVRDRFLQAVRWRDWKLVRSGVGSTPELYDLTKDPGETTDLARFQAEIVGKMTALMEEAYRPSPDYPVKSGPESG